MDKAEQPTIPQADREAAEAVYPAFHRIAGQSASCDLGVGCDEAGVCYAMANGKPEMCHRTTSLAAQEVDSGMSGDAVERAEWFWTNLPTGRKWTGLATHEKALVCHQIARITPSLAAQDDVTLVEELRAEISNLEAALTQIAGSHWERYGIDQTDIEDVPDLSAEEAMNVARDALSNTPAPSPPSQDGLVEALESAEVILSHYADYLDGISYHELDMHPYIPSVQQTRDDVRKALSAIKEQHHDG